MFLQYIFLTLGILVTVLFLSKRKANVTLNVVIIKSFASILFIATGAFGFAGNPAFDTYSGILMIIGAVFGLLGDIILDLKYVYPKDKDTYLYCGFISFLIGHLLYGASMIKLLGFGLNNVFNMGLGFVAMCLFAIFSPKIMGLTYGKFKTITVIYTATAGSLVGLGFSYMLSEGFSLQTILFYAGMILFLASDGVLGKIYFSNKEKDRTSRFYIVLNHALYYAAQFLIAMSISFYHV